MQTNHVDSTGGIRNYPILGRGGGVGGSRCLAGNLHQKEALRLSNTCFNGKVDRSHSHQPKHCQKHD